MAKTHRLVPLVLLALAVGAPVGRAGAQAPGYAEILNPPSGGALEGLVTIEGTADHPAFLHYELAFAHDPSPDGTWFPLGDPVATRARQATLGLWDTSGLSPGIYQLRLRVRLEGGAALEDTVKSLRIGLPPVPRTPTSSPAAPAGSVVTTATLAPTATPAPATPAPTTDPIELAFGLGGATAAGLLIGLAVYLPLRRRLAEWAGSMRMRRVVRREQRRRRRAADR